MGRAEGRDNGGVTTETTVAPAAAFEPATTVGPRVTGSASSRIRMYPPQGYVPGGRTEEGADSVTWVPRSGRIPPRKQDVPVA